MPADRGVDVTLDRLREADSDMLFAWINDRDLVVQSAPFRPVARPEHDAWFRAVRDSEDVEIFAIRVDGRLVGSCQLHSISQAHRSAELQIRIGDRSAQGVGVGTEATRQLLAYGFDDFDLHRIHLHVLAANERALRLYRRVGMRVEGTLREAALIDGTWVDVVLMAILRSEYRAGR